MKVKILKNYQFKTSEFKKGSEVDVDRQLGKRMIKLKVARVFGKNVIDKIVIANREYLKKKRSKNKSKIKK